MEELKSPDKKGISAKRKIGKPTYEPIIILYSMRIKEQTRKLTVGCSKHSFEVADKTDEVSSKHGFEVVDKTDEVSYLYLRQGEADVV
ncbi:N-ethylammeline chlorohydrolase [Streptococcus oralis]|uniref:N-ethylammeline chlorohydrolase n=1 Tax=Streptococcus oralis TaxID=1303 RepID=A0A139NZI3_STROR|nr:hypothetical protein [Streptococcus oralis]KXT81273.1 N-ethylammeline chlorohydrolase [Streptococcus oralis]